MAKRAPKVDHELCTGCGLCQSVCPTGVFEIKDGKAWVVKPEECIECESCVTNCPMQAIKLVSLEEAGPKP
ncbi:MAG: 4Fe-4S ferredoxin [Thermoprotei archaeon]|nr:MAG: 4Fe-4S ferredoxin [Thermoprotei archaeon]RLF24786.1 MAG: 4Fe-4S ferredoxin [Thermoprotei archaeon]